MKILTLALATLLGTSNALRLSGEYTSDVKLTTKIMENAKYYSGRELNDNGNGFEITAAHTILFRSCESMTVQVEFGNGNDDGISDTIKSLYKSGKVKAQKSYILFDVCLSDYCDSGKASDRTTFITDMASFINAFLEFIPNKTKAYCQGCFDNQNYCSYEAQKVYTGNSNSQMTYGSSNNNNGGNRFLENNNNNANVEAVEYIDCNQCQTFGCFSGQYANVDYSLSWIQSMTQCKQSDNPTYYKGAEITTGFMCNEAGDGVEIAAFLDQDCTLYTNQVAYGNMLTGTEYKYWYNSRTHIEYMFNVGYSCYDPYTKYINPYDEQQGTYGNNYQANNGEYYYPQAADYCTNVFQGSNMGVLDVKTCSDYSGNNNNNGRRVEEEDFDQVYTLAEGDVNNGYAVCTALTGMGGSGEHLYEKSASGSMYKYTGGAKTSAAWEKQNKKSNGGLIAFLVIFLLSVGVGIAYYFYNKKQNGSQQEKKEPLVDMTGPSDENSSAYA